MNGEVGNLNLFDRVVDSIDKDTIESSRIRLDHAEGFSFSQLPREWGFVFQHFQISRSKQIWFSL
jgi:hypothetical protein